jgi:putative endonuclease
MVWFVYALFNGEVNKTYIGYTSNIRRRLMEHNEKRGKHYTAGFHGKWQLIYKEECMSKLIAMKREKQLKSCRGREFVKKYIPL